MQQEQDIKIAHATIGGALPEIGLKSGALIYLAWDVQIGRLFLVRWHHTRWLCTCGGGACVHKRAVNSHVFALSQAPSQEDGAQ